jgi:hypothetical protein
MFMGFDENEADEDIREEFVCPFCSEYFDFIELCCHVDEEHPMEAKNRVCPVCASRVGVDMVAHITLQHGSILKMQRKRESRSGGSYSTLSFLSKELREGNLQSLFGGSPCIVSSSNATPDPLLDSFISPLGHESVSSQSHAHNETRSSKKISDETVSRRYCFSIFNFCNKLLFPLHGFRVRVAQVFLNELMFDTVPIYCFSCQNTIYCL